MYFVVLYRPSRLITDLSVLNDPDIDELSYDNTGGTKTVSDLSQYKQLIVTLNNGNRNIILNSNTIPYKMFKAGFEISSRIQPTEVDITYVSDTSINVVLIGGGYYALYGIK